MYDQQISNFYSQLARQILKTEDLNDIDLDIDPNEGLDNVITHEIEVFVIITY